MGTKAFPLMHPFMSVVFFLCSFRVYDLFGLLRVKWVKGVTMKWKFDWKIEICIPSLDRCKHYCSCQKVLVFYLQCWKKDKYLCTSAGVCCDLMFLSFSFFLFLVFWPDKHDVFNQKGKWSSVFSIHLAICLFIHPFCTSSHGHCSQILFFLLWLSMNLCSGICKNCVPNRVCSLLRDV